VIDRIAPSGEGFQQQLQIDLTMLSPEVFQVPHRAFQHRTHPNQIPGGMMVKGNGHLGQSLEELLFSQRCFAPHIFQNFVGGEELGVVEELNSTQQAIRAHTG